MTSTRVTPDAQAGQVRDGPLRILLLGASGRLGGAIAGELAHRPAQFHLEAPAREALRWNAAAADETAQRWLRAWQPHAVVNCIAASDVDACERQPGLARELNTALPRALAKAAGATGARLVHFSTDFVFDGALRRPYRETDVANPLSVYGQSKLAGERAVAQMCPMHWIFRVSWLYGSARANLGATLLDPANAGRVIRLADDRWGVPNPVQWLAREVADGLARDISRSSGQTVPAPGLYHLSCRGATTWHAFGLHFVHEAVRAGRIHAGHEPRIEAMAESTLTRAARRPRWSALDPAHYERTFGRSVPDWEAAIGFALGVRR